MTLAITLLLWTLAVGLAVMAARRSHSLLHDGARNGVVEFLHLIPRLGIGVIGSGYLAEVLPQDLIMRWLGPDSGLAGTALATLAGALTPGGPVVGFSIGATALKSGAGTPQVIAYSIAWALFAFPRIVLYELPTMPARVVWLRAAVSLPLPFLAALAAALAGKP